MLAMKEYLLAKSLDEAYEVLNSNRRNTLLGGMGFLKLGSKNINVGIDLSDLKLNEIKENDDEIRIGTSCTLRDLETNPIIKNFADGAIIEAVSQILGVQFRNLAQIGASIYSRYGFSDIIAVFLVLESKIKLHDYGEILLSDFLDKAVKNDILVEIIIPKLNKNVVFDCVRKSSSDFAVLNAAMSKDQEGNFKIAFGSRPAVAKIAEKSSNELSNSNIEKAKEELIKELEFGTNMRASKEYRLGLAPLVLERMYDVLEAK